MVHTASIHSLFTVLLMVFVTIPPQNVVEARPCTFHDIQESCEENVFVHIDGIDFTLLTIEPLLEPICGEIIGAKLGHCIKDYVLLAYGSIPESRLDGCICDVCPMSCAT